MDNIKPLTKFPKELLSDLTEVYSHILQDVEDKKINWIKWSYMHYAIDADAYITDEISNIFKDIQDISWHLYAIKKGTMTPHKDRGRACCLQIPLRVVDSAFTFSVKTDCLPKLQTKQVNKKWVNKFPKEQWVNKDGDAHWNYKQEFYDHYNGEFPYVQNTSQPHGGTSKSTVDRHLFSINIKNQSYEEIVELFKEWI